MAVKTLYILGTIGTTPNFWGNLQDGGSAPAAALSGIGWKTGKTAAPVFYRGFVGATVNAATSNGASSFIDAQTGPVKGTGNTNSTAGDSFVAGPYTGTFAATTWTFDHALRTSTAGMTGQVRQRVWKSANADGSSATALTVSTLVSAIVSPASSSADTNAQITWSPGAITLSNEYLFFELEWKETTSGSSSNNFVAYEVGAGHALFTTPDFAANVIYTLALSSGAYALTGSSATTFATRKLAGVTGAYALSGSTAAVKATRELAGVTGSYTLTGSALTPKRDLRLPEATGAFALTGSAATLIRKYVLAEVTGTYALTGSAATVFATRKLAGVTGTYALTGQTATVVVTRKLAAASGSYALTGSAATVFATRKLAGVSGTYFLTGFTAPLKRTFPLALASGAYSLTGSASATFVTRKLAAATGAFALTGSTATVLATRKLAAATGAYSLTGSAAQVFATRKLAGSSGAYVINGQTATLTLTPGSGAISYALAAATGHFTLSGSNGTLAFTSSTIGPLYTVSGPQVVGYLPLQDGIEQVRAVNFPGSTVQRETATGPTSGGSTNALLTNITTDHLLLNGAGILLLT